MINLHFKNKLLTTESETYLTNIIKYAYPKSWSQKMPDVKLMPDASKARLYHPDDPENNFLDAVPVISPSDDSLKSISFSCNNNTQKPYTWFATPLTELGLAAFLTPPDKISQQPRSEWAIRQEMIDEAFSQDTDEPEYNELDDDDDGTYDINKNFILSQHDIESKIGKYWYYFEQTIRNYLKLNNIMSTNIYTVKNITKVELTNNIIMTEMSNGTFIELIDLFISQQLAIVEELLSR